MRPEKPVMFIKISLFSSQFRSMFRKEPRILGIKEISYEYMRQSIALLSKIGQIKIKIDQKF